MRRIAIIGVLSLLFGEQALCQEKAVERSSGASAASEAIKRAAGAIPGTPGDTKRFLENVYTLEKKKIKLPLSLEDAVQIAVRNNLDLATEDLSREISRRQIVVERAVFDPYFSVDLNHSDNRDPTVDTLVLDPLNPQVGVQVNPFEVTSARSGFNGRTILGTTYSLSVVETRFKQPQAEVFTLDPRYNSRVEVTATQPLLKNGWYSVNSANLRIAKNNYDIARDQLELTTINTVYAVVEAYWDLVFTVRNYEAKLNAMALADEQLRIDNQRVRVGTMARIDLINTESQLALRKQEFDTAFALVENARDTLLLLMNYTGKRSLKLLAELNDEKSPFDNILIQPRDDPDTALVTPERGNSVNLAFDRRLEYRQSDLDLKNQQISVEIAENDLLPALDLTASWFQNGLDDSFSKSVDSVETGRFYNWSIGVHLELPLSYRGPRNALRNARDEKKKLLLTRHSLENAIVVEVDQTIRDLQLAHREAEDFRRRVLLQEALLEAEKTKLRVGKSIAYTVTQIENDLVDIQALELRSKTNYEKRKAAYRKAVGTLLEKFKIVFED